MPLNRDFIGREYPSSGTYEVAREKIRDFADAIGDRNPIYRSTEAAKEAGHPDVIAPPTFLTVVTFRLGGSGPMGDGDLGLNYAMVVHGEQRFVHHRPARAGDVLKAVTSIVDIRDAGKNELMTTKTAISTVDGEPVCDAYSTIVSRGTAASAQEG